MDFDDEIARLEAQLLSQRESDVDDDDPDISDDEQSSVDDDRIPPLPSSMLPTALSKIHLSKPKLGKKAKALIRGEDQNEQADQKSKAEKQLELMSYIKGYTPSEKIPFFCRLCRFTGKCVDEFEAHKSSKEHFEAQAREEKACFCRLCRKQFTSPAQIAEHLKGKAHKDLLLKRSDPTAFRAMKELEAKERGDKKKPIGTTFTSALVQAAPSTVPNPNPHPVLLVECAPPKKRARSSLRLDLCRGDVAKGDESRTRKSIKDRTSGKETKDCQKSFKADSNTAEESEHDEAVVFGVDAFDSDEIDDIFGGL